MGKTFANLMVDLKATNRKLKDRSERILMEVCGVEPSARELLDAAGGRVKIAIAMHKLGVGREDAERALEEGGGVIRRVTRRNYIGGQGGSLTHERGSVRNRG